MRCAPLRPRSDHLASCIKIIKFRMNGRKQEGNPLQKSPLRTRHKKCFPLGGPFILDPRDLESDPRQAFDDRYCMVFSIIDLESFLSDSCWKVVLMCGGVRRAHEAEC